MQNSTNAHKTLQNRGSTRLDQIIDAAKIEFTASGYQNTSVADIASRVGVVEAAIYKHVRSKRDLLDRVICTFYEPLVTSAETGMAAIENPIDQLRFLIRHHLGAFERDPGLCRLIISEARNQEDYADSDVANLSRRYTKLAMNAVSQGAASGLLRDDVTPPVVRDAIFGAIEHLAWRTLAANRAVPVGTADELATIILDGLRPRPSIADAAPPPALSEQQTASLATRLARLESKVAALQTSATTRSTAAKAQEPRQSALTRRPSTNTSKASAKRP